MGEHGLDNEGFYRWAMGDLVDNRNRGIFAEWLVGQALEVLSDGGVRNEWDAYDLLYGKSKVEVKASGRDQTWKQDRPSNPRFNIAPRKWTWEAKTNEFKENDPPARCADVYVFCYHKAEKATNENVQDSDFWEFWVISRRTLDRELGSQKSVGLGRLCHLASPVAWSGIRAEVDRCVDGDRRMRQ